MSKKIVVFDFDGTLSASDANMEFWKYCFRHSVRPWLFLPAIGVGYLIAKYQKPSTAVNKTAVLWRELIRCFISKRMIRKLSPVFLREHRARRFDWATDCIAREKADGNMAVLVSAGMDYLINPLVSDMGFDVIITSVMNKNIPWKFDFLCWGDNKVVALNKWAKENNIKYQIIRSYGDSASDLPIMRLGAQMIWIDRKTGKRVKK
ncbi:MAG: haloacid dehalogenase-like hydrolase [Rickettsiales bacterium]|jgi:HAD superfamily phosphoserine phosphatase-like hydrolase|nr:haloacid dehalogenase-like hydrolase [Rickettsiales bacterium]